LKGMPFKTHDISLFGALLIVTHYLPKGINVNLVFSKDKKAKLPGFTISTKIAYCKFAAIKKYKLGVKFHGLGEREKKFIQNLFNKY
ncbi:MAG: PilZ domain-containing protein, partial [Candidatus Omnitrophica bacterium]|nr:PilZ domain-containing protein [Candidatus Omnitrophota bacterium]